MAVSDWRSLSQNPYYTSNIKRAKNCRVLGNYIGRFDKYDAELSYLKAYGVESARCV